MIDLFFLLEDLSNVLKLPTQTIMTFRLNFGRRLLLLDRQEFTTALASSEIMCILLAVEILELNC